MKPSLVTKRLKEFSYFSPTTVEEAISVLRDYNGRASVLAGGTDLLSMMKLRAVTPECVINIKTIAGLDYIREEGRELKIGALTTISAILTSELIKRRCLSLHEAAKSFAAPQVRNMATIGGNICRSSSGADMVPPLLTFDAEVKLVGAKGERRVSLEDFFTGPGRNILDREILTEIVVPLRGERCGTTFMKLSRNSVDLAKLSCAVRIVVSGGRCDDISIALGVLANRPIRAKKAEQAIIGQEIRDEVIEKAAQKVVEDIAPRTSARSTAEYRTRVSQVLVKRLIKVAIDRRDRLNES